MYEFEISQMRSADLIRRADQERLAREATRTRRAARREARHAAEHEPHSFSLRRLRSRAA